MYGRLTKSLRHFVIENVNNNNKNVIQTISKCPICTSSIHFASASLKCKYEVLGLTPSASSKDIKDAYYKKSREFHPDLNQSTNASESFQKVSDAYETLSNEYLRDEYDQDRGYRSHPTSNRHEDFQESHDNRQFTRKMHSRMKRANHEFRGNEHFGQNPDARRAYQRIKYEEEFMQNLSPEMKKSYEDYLERLAHEKRSFDHSYERNISSNHSSGFAAIFFIMAVFTAFEFVGGILPDELDIFSSSNSPEKKRSK